MNYPTFYTALLVLMFAIPTWAAEEHDHGSENTVENNKKHEEKHDDESGHKKDDHGHDNENEYEHGKKNDNHANEHDEHAKEMDDHGNGHEGHDEHGEEEGGVELTAEQLRTGGIVVSELQPSKIQNEIRAPGEVIFNSYRSKIITPRISAQIVKRHARLGEKVKQGQALVTLSSVEMAEAQGDLLVADREWQRAKKLGKKVVSEKSYLAAQVAFQQATARALAFGMSKSQIATLLRQDDASKATGRFDLYATQDGTVTQDDFTTGEIIEPGRVLFDITDESSLWVEARLTPEDASQIHVSAPATIHVGKLVLKGRVTQIHHTLDESTRTLAVRIEVPNVNDRLHPGLFVNARIEAGTEHIMALTIPINAVLRSPDGDWMVFVEEEPGHFKPEEVAVLNTVGDRVIVEGIESGTRVVTQGAFFVQSEIAKSGFDIHNH